MTSTTTGRGVQISFHSMKVEHHDIYGRGDQVINNRFIRKSITKEAVIKEQPHLKLNENNQQMRTSKANLFLSCDNEKNDDSTLKEKPVINATEDIVKDEKASISPKCDESQMPVGNQFAIDEAKYVATSIESPGSSIDETNDDAQKLTEVLEREITKCDQTGEFDNQMKFHTNLLEQLNGLTTTYDNSSRSSPAQQDDSGVESIYSLDDDYTYVGGIGDHHSPSPPSYFTLSSMNLKQMPVSITNKSSISTSKSNERNNVEDLSNKFLDDQSGVSIDDFKRGNGSIDVSEKQESCNRMYKPILKIQSLKNDSKIVPSDGEMIVSRRKIRETIDNYSTICKTDASNSSLVKRLIKEESGRVLIYITTLRVIRTTYDRCRTSQTILRTQFVAPYIRDLFMAPEIQDELKLRLSTVVSSSPRNHTEQEGANVDDSFSIANGLPYIFIDGHYVGDGKWLQRMNEADELRKIIRPYISLASTKNCETCGGLGMEPCHSCQGRKKSMHRNHFTQTFVALRCAVCNEAALIRCTSCCSST